MIPLVVQKSIHENYLKYFGIIKNTVKLKEKRVLRVNTTNQTAFYSIIKITVTRKLFTLGVRITDPTELFKCVYS